VKIWSKLQAGLFRPSTFRFPRMLFVGRLSFSDEALLTMAKPCIIKPSVFARRIDSVLYIRTRERI